MKYINKIIVLLIIITQFTLQGAPSVRSKSRFQPSPATIKTPQSLVPQKTLPAQSTQEQVKPIPDISQPTQKPSEQPILSQEPLEDTSGDTIDEQEDPVRLYQEKLVISSYLTSGIIKYFFDAAINVVTHEKDKNNANKLLREFFNGLRYPLHRHMREFVSTYNDSNSFLNGLIEASITSIDGNAQEKKLFIESLNKFSLTLKGFKVYHIDQLLDNDIKTHLQNLKATADRLELSATPLPLLKNISQTLITSLNQNYESTLIELQKYLNNQVIKPVLPAREGSIKYAYRSGRKTVLGVTGYIYRNVINYAANAAVNAVSATLMNPLRTAAYLKSWIWKSPPPAENTPAIPEGESQGIMQSLSSNYNYLTTTGASDIVKDIISRATQDIKIIAADLVWPYFIRNYILPFIMKKTIIQADAYFYKIPGSQKGQSLSSDLLKNLTDLNFAFMSYSSSFIQAYVKDLIQNLSIKIVSDEKKTSSLPKDTSIEIITKALQTAQIEIFRHRRTIISELSNPRAFTGNYINYLHSQYIHDHNSNFTPEELKGQYKAKISLVEKSSFSLGDGSEQDYFKITEAGEAIAADLRKRSSNNPKNSTDLIELQGPLQKDMIKQLIQSFERFNELIIKELKSFGARSHNQLVQSYWLSVIDKDYSKKLMDHIAAVYRDLVALSFNAAYKLPLFDADGAALNYTDGNPIVIPQPQTSPDAAKMLYAIVSNYYIKPLMDTAVALQQEPLHSQLPQGKSWWVKYPIMTTKVGIRGTKFVINKIADKALVPVALAFITGGGSLAEMAKSASAELMTHLSFSGIAASIIGFDYRSTWEYLSSPTSWTGLPALLSTGLTIKSITGSLTNLGDSIQRPLGRLARE